MTFLGKLLTLFPAAICALALGCVGWLFVAPGWMPAIGVAVVLYAMPLICFHAHQLLFPLKEGGSRLAGKKYSPWFGGHQIQLIYLTFPALERVLRLVPGLFSFWLRLWGSKVGRGVYWTPFFELTDRGLLEVGDHVVFGHRAGVYPHLIKPTKANLLLYVKRVRIESGAFIGGGAVIAPGVVVREGAFVPAGTHLYPKTEAE